MFRRVLCALVVSAVIFPASYSFAATLGVTPPIRQPYPNVHLNIPLHSHIVPRFDHEVARIDGCQGSEDCSITRDPPGLPAQISRAPRSSAIL